jgi:uncharacterized protein
MKGSGDMTQRDTLAVDEAAAHAGLADLKANLSQMHTAVIAFSGGVDSTFLLKVAHDLLGGGAVAVTNRAHNIPAHEVAEAVAFCAHEGIRHILFETDPLEVEGFADNPQDRCYICKKAMFERVKAIAKERGAEHVFDGTNLDDTHNFRPGMRALEELGIESPLAMARLTKSDIRQLSLEMGLKTWNKPSGACLVTRFPYGTHITSQDLARVEQAEGLLASMGFGQLRVRVHEDVARIEILPEQMPKVFERTNRERIVSGLRNLGYTYVTLDLQGYRSGSMDEPIS